MQPIPLVNLDDMRTDEMPVRQKPSRIVQNTLDMLIRKPLDLSPATGVGARRNLPEHVLNRDLLS